MNDYIYMLYIKVNIYIDKEIFTVTDNSILTCVHTNLLRTWAKLLGPAVCVSLIWLRDSAFLLAAAYK